MSELSDVVGPDLLNRNRAFEATPDWLKRTSSTLISRLRDLDYDVGDLHREASELREIIFSWSEREVALRSLKWLDKLVSVCLRETALPQELAFEATGVGFALLDAKGRIISCNSALHRILAKRSLDGVCLFDCASTSSGRLSHLRFVYRNVLEKQNVEIVRSVFQAGKHEVQVVLELGYSAGPGSAIAYAIILDVTKLVEGSDLAFEVADFGVVRADDKRRIQFVNDAAARLVNSDRGSIEGQRFDDFVSREHYKTMLQQHVLRSEGQATRFEIELKRTDNSTHPVEVTGLPVFDMDGKTRIGSLSFVRSMQLERIRDELIRLTSEATYPHDLVSNASQVLQELIPHDALVWTIYQDGGEFAWPAHVEPRPKEPWPTRWFRISADTAEMMNDQIEKSRGIMLRISDFKDSLAASDPLYTDPTIPFLIEQGMDPSLTLVDKVKGKFHGAITLLRKSGSEFEDADISRLRSSGILSVIKTARRMFEQYESVRLERLGFFIAKTNGELRKDPTHQNIEKANREIANEIAKELSKLYRWKYVSIFQIDASTRSLICLASYEFGLGSRDQYVGRKMRLGEGLIGLAVRQKQALILNDTEDGSPESKAFKQVNEKTKSAWSIPIEIRGRIAWVLNIEDVRTQAFSGRDEKVLNAFIERIRALLEVVLADGLVHRILNEATEAVLIVDGEGRLVQTNDQAKSLLEAGDTKLENMRLAKALGDKRLADYVMQNPSIKRQHTSITGLSNMRRQVTLSSQTLPELFGIRVVYLTDLRMLHWEHRINLVGGAISQSARQTREPISVITKAINYLSNDLKIGEVLDDETVRGIRSVTDDVRANIKSLKLTYDRVANCFPAESDEPEKHIMNLREILNNAISESVVVNRIDSLGSDDIKLHLTKQKIPIYGDQDRLLFVFRSILNFLKKRKPDDGQIEIAVTVDDEAKRPITVKFSSRTGKISWSAGAEQGDPSDIGRGIVELGEYGLKRIVTEHLGTYERTSHGDRTEFTLSLPLATTSIEKG